MFFLHSQMRRCSPDLQFRMVLPTLCHPANSQRACAGPWGMPQLLISLYHQNRRRQGKMRRALPYPETPRRPSIPRPWRGRCSTNRPQAAFPAPSSPRPASISKTPAAARPRLHPAPRPAPKARFENRLPHLPRARLEIHPSRPAVQAHSPVLRPKGCAAPPAGLHWAPAPAAGPRTPAAARRSAPAARAKRYSKRQAPRAEWQPKRQRKARCPLGLALFTIPKNSKRKSRQRQTALPASKRLL